MMLAAPAASEGSGFNSPNASTSSSSHSSMARVVELLANPAGNTSDKPSHEAGEQFGTLRVSIGAGGSMRPVASRTLTRTNSEGLLSSSSEGTHSAAMEVNDNVEIGMSSQSFSLLSFSWCVSASSRARSERFSSSSASPSSIISPRTRPPPVARGAHQQARASPKTVAPDPSAEGVVSSNSTRAFTSFVAVPLSARYSRNARSS
mmetsp:Transcript_20988/g.48096  ORF Transcript_20988/g.48096 Transcript_20988/m.48096 type:complete len:205 (-) Transcript_20988:135-749(-)